MRSFVILKGLVKEEKRNWILKEGLSSFFLDIDNLRSLYFKPDYKGDRDYLVNSFDELVYSRFIEVVCTKASTGTLIVVDMEDESTAILEQLARIFGYTVFYKVFPIPQDYVTKNRKYSDLRYIQHGRAELKKDVNNTYYYEFNIGDNIKNLDDLKRYKLLNLNLKEYVDGNVNERNINFELVNMDNGNNINNFDKSLLNDDSKKNFVDTTVVKGRLPQTGESILILVIISLLLVLCIIYKIYVSKIK